MSKQVGEGWLIRSLRSHVRLMWSWGGGEAVVIALQYFGLHHSHFSIRQLSELMAQIIRKGLGIVVYLK